MHAEIDRYPAFEAWLADSARPADVVVQGLDLTAYEAQLAAVPLAHCVFIGCTLPQDALQRASRDGAVMIPRLPVKSFNVFRTQLYSPEELFAGFLPDQPLSYRDTPDALIYAEYMEAPGRMRSTRLDQVLARRLHDFSITDAVEEFLDSSKPAGVVAVMGGHDAARGCLAYRGIASLARTLTRAQILVVSGGGPGVMEAANLGAWFANESEERMQRAIDDLAVAPLFTDAGWLSVAWRVRTLAESPGRSLGVPTWFYGHEPPNAFATDIAKYFENSVREEGLLAIARDGVVFAEGNAGTVQEIFQDACQNYYKTYYERASPMVLFGRDYWTVRKPVAPLLRTLAAEKGFEPLILISDDLAEIADFLIRTVASHRLPRK